MNEFIKLGRYFFAMPMIIFGVEHFIYVDFVTELVPVWIPERRFWAYFTGIAFIAAGLSIIFNRKARLAAILLGIMIFLFFLSIHIPIAVANWSDVREWTYASQALAMCGIALVLAGAMPKEN